MVSIAVIFAIGKHNRREKPYFHFICACDFGQNNMEKDTKVRFMGLASLNAQQQVKHIEWNE